jgi:hypothetical protein
MYVYVYTSVSELECTCLSQQCRSSAWVLDITTQVLTYVCRQKQRPVLQYRSTCTHVNMCREYDTLLHAAVTHCSAPLVLLRLLLLHAASDGSHY